MKITMYELLGLVKDGKAPKKIKHKDLIFTYSEEDKDYLSWIDDKSGVFLFNLVYITPILNDEIEIIEEKKIPEKIKIKDYDKCIHNVTHKEKELSLDIRELQIRYNDLLDYLKSKGE